MDLIDKILFLLYKNNVFLTGGGGVGKSYLSRQVIEFYRSNNKNIVILGSTGISAAQIGGQTIHSFFRFGITNSSKELMIYDAKQQKKLKQLYKLLAKCDIIIIDEISMVSSWMLDMIRFRLKSGSFKGQLLFVGDFFQLPPVKINKEDSLLSESIYAFASSAWDFFDPKIVLLNKPKRTSNLTFFNILSRIRIGLIDDKILSFLQKLHSNSPNNADTVLFGRNKEADELNKIELDKIKSDLYISNAIEIIHDESLSQTRFQSWKNNLNIRSVLELKKGAKVLFCANKLGSFYNGQRGEIIDISANEIMVKKEDGEIVKVEMYEYNLTDFILHENEIQEVSLASIKQFPLRLSYAITIHKSQGMSIENLSINIDHIFEKSQFYVALSRATDPDKLHILYSKNDLKEHLKRCIKIDEEVVEFYKKAQIFHLEE